MNMINKGCLQKKIAEKGTLVHTGGRGVKKSPFFSLSKRGHILMGGGVIIFLSHVPCSLLCFWFQTICSLSWSSVQNSCPCPIWSKNAQIVWRQKHKNEHGTWDKKNLTPPSIKICPLFDELKKGDFFYPPPSHMDQCLLLSNFFFEGIPYTS